MSKGYVKRYLKLNVSRLLPSVTSHATAVLCVLLLILITIYGISKLPQVAHNPEQAVAEPISKLSVSPTAQLPAPEVSAKNVFILDLATDQVIYQKNADEQIYPASTTKIATALVIMKHFDLDQVITVTREYPEGQVIGVKPGDKFTVENLLYALLIHSANDVAEVFAENYPGGRTAFVAEMNATAQSLGLRHTYFKNPSGLDEDGHFSSAADLSRLAAVAMRNPLFKRIVSTENSIITSTDQSQHFLVTNTNELLGKMPGVLGVKTGFTDKAGESLISEVSRPEKDILVAVMGSEDRFGDTQKLITWVYGN